MAGAEDRPMIVTASWSALHTASKAETLAVQPVRISLGTPKFWPQAASFPAITGLMPDGWMFGMADDAEFEVAYLAKLDRIGVDVIRRRLDSLRRDKPLALCCFEPHPADCHRGKAATWIQQNLGVPVPELSVAEPPQLQLTIPNMQGSR